MTHNRTLVGMTFALAAALLWAITLDSSLLLPASFPTIELLAGRYGIQVLLLIVLVLPFRGTALVRTPRPTLQLLRGATMLVMPLAFTLAIRRISIPDAWAAEWAGPLIGAIIARFLLDERASKSAFAIALVATMGAAIARSPSLPQSITGLATILLSALAFGGFLLLTRVLRSERTSTGLFWTAACVFIPSLLLLPINWQPLTLRSATGLALMGSLWLLVLLSIDEALRRAPLALLVPFFLTEIVWERLLFREPWGRGADIGALAIFACAAWCVMYAWRSAGSVEPLAARAVG